MNFQMSKLDLEKAEEPEIKLPISAGSLKKWDSSRKTPTSALLTMPKHLTVWITINCGKFFKRWEYQTTWSASWFLRKHQLELDMEQQAGSKSGKEYIKVAYCHPAYLIHMQSTSWEMLDWMKHKLDSCKCEFLLNGYLWCVLSCFSRVPLSVCWWAIAPQASLSTGFPR